VSLSVDNSHVAHCVDVLWGGWGKERKGVSARDERQGQANCCTAGVVTRAPPINSEPGLWGHGATLGELVHGIDALRRPGGLLAGISNQKEPQARPEHPPSQQPSTARCLARHHATRNHSAYEAAFPEGN
jgi:hypothetical protein